MLNLEMTSHQKPKVFDYESGNRFLVDSLNHLQKSDPKFSIRRWSKQCGIASHTLIVMILQGKRKLTLRLVPFVSDGLLLTTRERQFFQTIVQMDYSRSTEEKDLCRMWMSGLRPADERSALEVDQYLAISDWIHTFILALSETKDFEARPEWIWEKCAKKVELLDIRSALLRLIDLGLIKEVNGKWECTYERVTTRDDVSTAGAKEYHRQSAQLSVDATQTQAITEREFQSFSIALRKKDLPLAKELIREFRTKLCDALDAPGEADIVYQTNLHFFRLSENSSESVPTAISTRDGSETHPHSERNFQ
jgi:uncharacterized protein (TIGR02147 family)